jgi:transposase
MRILAIDLGKSRSVACVYDAVSGEAHYRKIFTGPAPIRSLIEEVQPQRVVIEICSAAGWVSDLVGSFEVELQVANTSAPAWRWSNTKRKTDRDDALRLAQLSSLNQLPQVAPAKQKVRQWRALIRYRHHLVRRRTQIRNRIRALFEREGLTLPKGHICWTATGMTALRTEGRDFDSLDEGQLWRGELACELDALLAIDSLIKRVEEKLNEMEERQANCRLLRSIPGVGPRLAEIVVAILGDPRRFRNGKQVASYAGLTPRQYQSGDSDRQGRISRQGNTLLRAMLVEVSWVSLRYNDWARAVYERVRRGSSVRKKIAIVAVARRLLVRCWAMLREGTTWRPSIAPHVA